MRCSIRCRSTFGPPTIDTQYVSTTTDSGNYVIENSGFCDYIDKAAKNTMFCFGPIESRDGAVNPRFENRSTPAFGPIEFELVEMCYGCFRFNPVVVEGAVGDEIWLVVEDDHPEWRVGEALIWTLPTIPDAPVVTIDESQLVWADGQHLLTILENDITDPDEPLTLEAVVWREIENSWVQVYSDFRSIASGEALDVALPGGE